MPIKKKYFNISFIGMHLREFIDVKILIFFRSGRDFVREGVGHFRFFN